MLRDWQPVTKSLCNKIKLNVSMIQSNTKLKPWVSRTISKCPKIALGNKEQNRTCKLLSLATDFLVLNLVEPSCVITFTVTHANEASGSGYLLGSSRTMTLLK